MHRLLVARSPAFRLAAVGGRARAHHRLAVALLPQPCACARWALAQPRAYVRAAQPADGQLVEAGRDEVSALRLLARGLYLAALFAPLLLASPLALVSASCREALLRLLVRTLGLAGPCAMKLGQWASTRPDLLPRNVCAALSKLHESARTHPLAETRRACEAAFGAPLDSLFAIVSETPIGSGCIAQVHKARLLDGTLVAIKVLHPDAARTSALDLALIRLAVDLLEGVAPLLVRGVRWLALREASLQFEGFMRQQLDLTVEAANLERFSRNFALEPIAYTPALLGGGEDNGATVEVRFPTPIAGLVARGVLVETLAEGRSLSALLGAGEGEGADQLDAHRRRRLARAGLRAFLQMVLVHNFVHADLHPGNIFCSFTEQPSVHAAAHAEAHGKRGAAAFAESAQHVGQAAWAGRWGSGGERMSLTFIDAGLTVELSRRDRLNFLRLFTALVNGDGRRAGGLMLEHARESDCDDPETFMEKVDDLVRRTQASRRGEFTLSRLDVGRVLLEVLSAVREHRVMIEANFTTLISSIVILEGLGRQLDAELDLFALAVPLLARLAVSDAFHAMAGSAEAEGG